MGHTELEGQFYFSERQAKSILEMRLQRLTGLEKDKIRAELKNVLQTIEYYNSILSSEKELLHVLKQELLDIKSTFASPRLTKISDQGFEHVGYESMIAEEEMIATFTLAGYVKRVSLDSYRAQNRGGKGKIGLSVSADDVTTKVVVGSTHADLLFFTNIGRVYRVKMYELPFVQFVFQR